MNYELEAWNCTFTPESWVLNKDSIGVINITRKLFINETVWHLGNNCLRMQSILVYIMESKARNVFTHHKIKVSWGFVIIWRHLVASLFANIDFKPMLRHVGTLKLEWTRLLKKTPRGVSSALVSGTSPWESPVEELWKIYQIPASWKKQKTKRQLWYHIVI